MPSAAADLVYQPAVRTKPIHRKRRGITSALIPVPVVPRLGASSVHTPLDLQLTRDLFNEDATKDAASDEHQLDANPPPPIPASSHRRNARRRPVRSPGKQGGTSEFQRAKRFKGGEGLLPSDTDVMSSGVSPMHSLPTPLLPPATQSMVSVP